MYLTCFVITLLNFGKENTQRKSAKPNTGKLYRSIGYPDLESFHLLLIADLGLAIYHR